MQAEILLPTPENIEQVVQALRLGEAVGLPTETVYGLAADGLSETATQGIFQIKGRPSFNPLILHVGAQRSVGRLADEGWVESSLFSPRARQQADRLMALFWPGPLTLILPNTPKIPDSVTAKLPTVAIRSPLHSVAQEVLKRFKGPLAAPSANRFKKVSPTTAQAVQEELGTKIRWILEGGPCAVGIESTILGFGEKGRWVLNRPGKITRRDLEEVLGEPLDRPALSGRIVSPGMLEEHYAPEHSLYLLPKSLTQLSEDELRTLSERFQHQHVGFLLESEASLSTLEKQWQSPFLWEILSPQGDLERAAHTLFSSLRSLDKKAQILIAEPFPKEELGEALMDRLRRASRSLEKVEV